MLIQEVALVMGKFREVELLVSSFPQDPLVGPVFAFGKLENISRKI